MKTPEERAEDIIDNNDYIPYFCKTKGKEMLPCFKDQMSQAIKEAEQRGADAAHQESKEHVALLKAECEVAGDSSYMAWQEARTKRLKFEEEMG